MTSETRAGIGVQQIPATFRQGSGARAAAIARAVLCGGLGIVLLVAPYIGKSKAEPGHILMSVVFGAGLLMLAGLFLQIGLTVVTINQDRITLAGPLRTRVVPWTDVAHLQVTTISPSAQRTAQAGSSFGVVGALVAHATADGTTDTERRSHDPFENPAVRGGHVPIGMLVDSSGKRIGTLPHVFGWMFFDALIAAASASGVEVRRVDRLKA